MKKHISVIFFLLFVSAFSFADETLQTLKIPVVGAAAQETNWNQSTVGLQTVFAVSPIVRAQYFYQNTMTGSLGKLESVLSGALTPITVGGAFQYIYTLPIPVLELSGGLTVATGWPVEGFGNGVGMQSNFYDGSISTNVYSHEFMTKDFLRFDAGAALQYDLASIIPGDWSHLQIRTYQELYYRYFLGSVSDNNVWEFENTVDNMKSFRYYGSYYIGYRMPIFLNRIGFLYDNDIDFHHYGDSTIASGGWGSDFINASASIIQTYSLKPDQSMTLDFTIRWANERVYQKGFGNEVELWSRRIDKNIVEYWHLRNVTLNLTVKL